MNYVIAVCLGYILLLPIAAIVRLIRLSRREKLKYIKNFKRGKFALMYLAIIPLYFLAYRFNGVNIEGSLLNAVKSSVDIVILKYDYATVAPLMAANLFYKITVATAFALVAANAIMFSISFGGQFLLNALSCFFTYKFRKKVVIVVGNNPNSLDILGSVEKQRGKAVLMDKLTPDLRDEAFLRHADCIHLYKDEDFGKKLRKFSKTFQNKTVYVVLNCENDAVSLRYVKQLYRLIEEKNLKGLPLTKSCGLQAYVFADKTNESAFAHYEEASCGLIKFISRHEQIAMDFIVNHPLTEYMNEQQLDYATATVKEHVNINVLMIGFGKLNETLFLTSVSNNQFLTIKDKSLKPKAVNYHLYDRNYPAGSITQENTSVHSKSLNHGYMRYEQFLKENASNSGDYLEFIPAPAKIQFHPCDITHPDFYASLHKTLNDQNGYSYVVISLGTDMENIELAEKLQQKFHEWETPSFVKIFVKVRDKKLVDEIKNDFTGDMIEFFGTNRDTVYNAAKILSEQTASMAKRRHLCYVAEELKRTGKEVSEEELERLAREKWYLKYKQFQRESNIYACLSIRMKLQLIGYDYATEGEDLAKEFEAKYEKNDARTPSNWQVYGRRVWDYSNAEQERGAHSLRRTYAVQEHQRWCSNMICDGVIPSSVAEIKKNGGRILEKRLHGNLTTMEGLVEYRRLVAQATGQSEEKTDVIRYDYQLMDDVVWLLHKSNYKLVKKS